MSARNGKPCIKCGANEWDKSRHCKKCKREQAHRYNQNNTERENERKSRWVQNNRTHVREMNKQWRQNNRERDAELSRQWYQANRDKVIENSRQWQKANPDKVAEKNRRWVKNNPETHNAQGHRRRTRKTEAGGSYTAAEFKAMCTHYGNKCLRCGRPDVKLEFDHVIPVSKGGSSDISNGQPLCRSCNAAKGDRHIDYRPDAGPLRWLQAKLFG